MVCLNIGISSQRQDFVRVMAILALSLFSFLLTGCSSSGGEVSGTGASRELELYVEALDPLMTPLKDLNIRAYDEDSGSSSDAVTDANGIAALTLDVIDDNNDKSLLLEIDNAESIPVAVPSKARSVAAQIQRSANGGYSITMLDFGSSEKSDNDASLSAADPIAPVLSESPKPPAAFNAPSPNKSGKPGGKDKTSGGASDLDESINSGGGNPTSTNTIVSSDSIEDPDAIGKKSENNPTEIEKDAPNSNLSLDDSNGSSSIVESKPQGQDAATNRGEEVITPTNDGAEEVDASDPAQSASNDDSEQDSQSNPTSADSSSKGGATKGGITK